MRKISGILITLVWFAAASASAATFVVPDDFTTIQAAVDRAEPGDAVLVKDGEYTENVVVGKDIRLESENGPDYTVITAAEPTAPALKVTGAEGYTVSGFTLTGSKTAGFEARESHNGLILDNRALRNNNGFMIYSSNGNTIRGNSGDNNELYGIYLESSRENLLTENTANRNKDRGIFLSYSHNNQLVDNDANLNKWNGITLWESNTNLIKDNLTLRNTYGVVIGNSTGNVQEGNTSLPNVFIILPIVLLYLGIITYIIQKNLLKAIYGK